MTALRCSKHLPWIPGEVRERASGTKCSCEENGVGVNLMIKTFRLQEKQRG